MENKQIKTVQNDSYGQTNEELLIIFGTLMNSKRKGRRKLGQVGTN